MPTDFICGKSGEITVSGTQYNVTGWDATGEADVIDVTHSGSGGYREKLACLQGCSGTITANWDQNAKPTSTPPAMYEGQTIDLHLYYETAGDFLDVPEAVITSLAVTSAVESAATNYTVSWVSNGTYTWPT